jgi:hypothetical protein
MTPVIATLGAAVLVLASTGMVSAQQSPGTARPPASARTIISPQGGPPSFITPQPNGAYTIHRLGEPPTYVTPLPNGSMMIQRPGEAPVISSGGGLPR